MAWPGFFTFGGNEVINAERTQVYLADASASWFNPVYDVDAIARLQETTYVDPFSDPAPWADPDHPETYRFWGAYPLRVTGLEDSTRSAEVTESVRDGGWVGPLRHNTRSVVFEIALLGADECAVEYGLRWLKAALGPAACSEDSPGGAELCYFACQPCLAEVCTPEEIVECNAENQRTLRNVRVVTGPTVTARRTARDGAAIWTATFTAVAGVPFEFGVETPLVEGFMVNSDPWVPEVTPADWDFSATATVHVDEVCSEPAYQPIIDPECPAVLVPPGPPSVRVGCYEPPEAWDRRWFTIPRKYIPYWGDVVPVVKVQARSKDVRSLRLRFYADPEGNASTVEDPCSYCGDILFSYIPADHTLVFDGVTQTVYAEGPGGTLRRADSLVFKTDGTPFDWPLLTCGAGYVVAVDLPDTHTGALPAVDLSVVPRAS